MRCSMVLTVIVAEFFAYSGQKCEASTLGTISFQSWGGSINFSGLLFKLCYAGEGWTPCGLEESDSSISWYVTPADVGRTFYATGATHSEFDEFVSFLTNGIDDRLYAVSENWVLGNCGSHYENFMESSISKVVEGVDFHGYTIQSIALTIVSFDTDTPGSYPNGDGDWTDYTYNVVFSIETGPYISSIEPSSGAPGILATIRGQGFNASSVQRWVNFGPSEIWGTGISSKDVSWTDTEIVVKVPYPSWPYPSGEEVVEVTVQKRFPTQASNSVSFTYKMPHIDSISPSSATPRTEVAIRGQNFGVPPKAMPEGYGIKFGKSNAYYWKSWTDNEIVIQAPKDYGTGDTEKRILKWIVMVLELGITEDLPDFVINAIEELLSSGVEVRPGEGEVQVNVIVTTPVGQSNAEPFTYTVK